MSNYTLRPIEERDSPWIRQFIEFAWGGPFVVARGRIHHPHLLPGFIAVQDTEPVGLITYTIDEHECEIITLNSMRLGEGIGTALLGAAEQAARTAGCRRLCLVTTNDNLDALRFYQKRGFALAMVYANALEIARRLKPQIPLVGNQGIPLRDEIELAIDLAEELTALPN